MPPGGSLGWETAIPDGGRGASLPSYSVGNSRGEDRPRSQSCQGPAGSDGKKHTGQVRYVFLYLKKKHFGVWCEAGAPFMASGRTQVPKGITGAETHGKDQGVRGGAAPSSTSGTGGVQYVQVGSALQTPWASGDVAIMAGPQRHPSQADGLRPVPLVVGQEGPVQRG